MAITPKNKNENEKLVNWFPLPSKGDLFMSWWYEWEVLEINDPTAWFCKILYKTKEANIWFFKLWENIDQIKWWYTFDQKLNANMSQHVKDLKKANKSVKKMLKKWSEKTEKKKKPNPKAKYNWDVIKQEYFESDFIDVAPFLKSMYGINTGDNWNALEKSKWWWVEKKKIQEDLKLEALKNFKSNMQKKWDEVFNKLEQAHVKWLEDLTSMILDQWLDWEIRKAFNIRDKETWELIEQKVVVDKIIKPYLWHFDIINILKHVKLEKWEPTEIVNDWLQAKRWLEEMREKKEIKQK